MVKSEKQELSRHQVSILVEDEKVEIRKRN